MRKSLNFCRNSLKSFLPQFFQRSLHNVEYWAKNVENIIVGRFIILFRGEYVWKNIWEIGEIFCSLTFYYLPSAFKCICVRCVKISTELCVLFGFRNVVQLVFMLFGQKYNKYIILFFENVKRRLAPRWVAGNYFLLFKGKCTFLWRHLTSNARKRICVELLFFIICIEHER